MRDVENVSKPSLICFTTEMKEKCGEGRASMIARLEDLELDNQQLLAVREIQEEAAAKLRNLLGL